MHLSILRLGSLRLSAVMLGFAGVGLAGALVGSSPAQKTPVVAEPAVKPGAATMRRLNETQYRNAIRDIFGAGVTVPGRFDPQLRDGGLLAIGDGKIAVSSSGFEQYELRARQIAAKVLSDDGRKKFLACTPQSAQAFDKDCATAFIGKYGRLLYRRPLTREETTSITGLASAATTTSKSFYKGLEIALARMLASPNFIFRTEFGVADPAHPGTQRLDDYSLATRISFFLWNSPPDAVLLDAVAGGALRTPDGVRQQVERMVASPRFVDGTRGFFSDMLAYDRFDGLSKEQTLFPKFTSQLAKDAQEQALRTIVDLLVTTRSDYRELFTTKKTFLNRNLAALYRVRADATALDGWIPYQLSDQDPRKGILMLPAFLMLDPSHEGRSSPTIRGKAVRELLLCQTVPPPPPNVNFALVDKVDDPLHKTARQRLAAHATNPVCAGCHRAMDPIGLSMENYDAIGQYRTTENGETIDASGSFDGKSYASATELAQMLHDSSSASGCVVQRAYEYGVGHQVADGDTAWLTYASQRFADGQYRFPDLMRDIATSAAFRAISTENSHPVAHATKVAAAH